MRVNKIYFLFIFFIHFIFIKSQQNNPNLVVAIVVDQMRYEYLDRFWSSFGDSGFKRLIRKGALCRNAHFSYIPTYTGPAHATIFTGARPNVHGIIGNNWYDRNDFSPVYCAGDWNSQTICLCKTPHDKTNISSGQMSPNNLLCNTVGDELKLSDSLSKVFGVSIKDRGAILSSGALADGAYWLNNNSQWITSSYYENKLPNWIVDFENKYPAKSYMKGTWQGDGFNYNLEDMTFQKGISSIKYTPKGNEFTLDFARNLISEEKLGADNHTDLVILSFSSTDYVGHRFGPYAAETKSTFIELDATISNLLEFLDQNIGMENYLIMLTSDHGAATSPKLIEKLRLKGGNFNSALVKEKLDSTLFNRFAVNGIIAKYSNMQFYLNFNKLDSFKLSIDEVYRSIKEVLLDEPSIKEVFDINELNQSYTTHERTMLINGIHPKRSGDIFLLLNPGYVEWSRKSGTSHGTHYNYDTHVPVIFYGSKINNVQIADKISICDIAPTLSVLMEIGFPSACTGTLISKVFK